MSTHGLLAITSFHLPVSHAEKALAHMRAVGKQGLEGVALWAGVIDGTAFHVQETIIPAQEASRTEQGLLYVVEGEELHRINRELYRSGLRLAAQIHSHPGRAYHSDTDDAYPIVAVLGGVSIVVPNFAKGPLDVNTWAVYRLTPDWGWTELRPKEKREFLHLINDIPAPPAPARRWYQLWK